MYSATFPDWKRIGRRISKKLRDVLGPHPNVPSPSVEERRAQRLRDALVGLVYFDTFEELESWHPTNVDPIQQANQPLLPRVSNVHNQDGPKTRLLLCHDYKGGYHEYESVRPSPLNSESYSCKHLRYVDTFVYFSHKLLCIPPPAWINVLHRHGVEVLGTFLIEPQTPKMDRLLMKTNGKFTVAKQLTDMADAYGFDGWLLNIEQDAPVTCQDWHRNLVDFLDELQVSMSKHKKVFWYDALTTEGDVYYQNGLTSMNRPYVQSTSGLFTNYKWTEKKLAQSELFAVELGIPLTRIFFGIDVWAQNTDMPGPPRVTYPPVGGGGTNTGLAMSFLSANGFSTAMFGPAWAYEHFTAFNISSGIKPSIAHQVDDSMWTGICLPDELYCDCREGKPHHTDFYQSHAIIEFAQEYPTGSSRFFETRFVQAFQRCIDNASNQPRKVQYWPTLGSQDPMPSLIPMSAKQWQAVNEGPVFRVLYGELRSKPTSSLTIFTKLAGCYEEEDSHSISKPQMTRLCLYNLRMIADGSLEATIEVQGKLFEEEIAHGIYLAYADHVSRTLTYSNWDVHLHEHILSHIPIQHESGDLVEIGVYMDSGFDRSTPLVLMEITRIIIKPKRAVAAAYAIGDVHVKDRGDSPNVQKRIIWKWERIPQRKGRDWPQGIPWSRTTGPFSSFTVRTSGKVIGEAYCLEFPLKNSDVEDLGDEITIIVVGHMFGAGDVNSPSISIPRADLLINGDKSE